MAPACNGRVVAVIAVTKVELMLQREQEVTTKVELKIQAVLENAVFALVSPGIDTVFLFFRIALFITGVHRQFLRRFALHDEKTHEVEVVADGETLVQCELETVAHGASCAEVVTAERVVVSRAATEGYSREHEVVGEGGTFSFLSKRWNERSFEIKSYTKAGSL